MDNRSFIIGVIGNIISVFLFLSPIKTFVQIVRKGSTEQFESVPYVCTLLSTSLWTYYGIIRPGAILVATVNGFGAFVQLIYVTMFLTFATPVIRAKTAKLVVLWNVVFLGVAIWSTMSIGGVARIKIVGTIGAALNIAMYSSPLAALKSVIETRSVRYMPFLLSFCSFLNGGIWTLYAVLVKDIYLLVPNAIGFILGAIQLVVYARYRSQGNEQPYDQPLI